VKWHLDTQDFVKFTGKSYYDTVNTRWEAEDIGHSVPIQALSNVGTVVLTCKFTSYNPDHPLDDSNILTMTINVINDLVEIDRPSIEAPAVGNPLSTPQLYLKSNCGAQVFQNSMISPEKITNCMVSATIQNSFSAGYSIQASGDAPVRIATANLSNLSFQLVDGNFRPLKLLNPLYLTMSVSPVPEDPGELAGMMIPKNSPTSAEKAVQDAQAKKEQEAREMAEAQEKEKTNTQNQAFQLMVQYFGPLVQQQQAIAAKQQEQAQLEQNKLALLQDPAILEDLSGMSKTDQPSYLDLMAQQMLQQQMQQAQAQQQQQQMGEEEEEEPAPEPQDPDSSIFMFDANNLDTDF
jgi:hypothetical protein